MISQKLTQPQKTGVLIVFIVILGLIGIVLFMKFKQDAVQKDLINNQNVETEPSLDEKTSKVATDNAEKVMKVTISVPDNKIVSGNEETLLTIMIQNTANEAKKINVNSVTMKFDPAKIAIRIPENPCGPEMPMVWKRNVTSDTIEITCSTSPRTNYPFPSGETKTLGTFYVSALKGVSGSTDITFSKIQIVETPSYVAISDNGTGITLDLIPPGN